MERLTDKKVAADLKNNVEGLQAVGIAPDISYLRYIKLAEYEDAEEQQEQKQERCENCVYCKFMPARLFCDKHHITILYFDVCSDFERRLNHEQL